MSKRPAPHPAFVILAGALLVAAMALFSASQTAMAFSARLASTARTLPAQQGPEPAVDIRFVTARGWPTRHPMLTPRRDLSELERVRIAQTIAKKVEAKHDHEDRNAGPKRHPWRLIEEVLRRVQHRPPRGRGRLLAEAG